MSTTGTATAETLLFLAVEKLGGELRIPLEVLYLLPDHDSTLTSHMENRELVLTARRLKPRTTTNRQELEGVLDAEILEPDTPTLPCDERPRL